MDLELTDEQLALQEVVHDVVTNECPASLVRSVIGGTDDGGALWKTYVELHWPTLAMAVDEGGMGHRPVELVLLLEELGWAADPTPFVATTTQYAPLVRTCVAPELRGDLLAAVREGGTGAAAFGEPHVRAVATAGGWELRGTARHVVDGDRADEIVVVADTDDGPAVLVVPAAAATATRLDTFDPTLHVAQVAFEGVRVGPERASLDVDGASIDRSRQEAVVGIAAVMVGACRRMLEMVLDHVTHRRQFGVPIGSFQAVQHMAVDVYLAIERARALCQFAALTVAEDDVRRSAAASMAKVAAGDCQRIACQHGVQLFGGLGYTWENDLHLYLRRAKAGELLFGTTVEHRARVAREAFDALSDAERA